MSLCITHHYDDCPACDRSADWAADEDCRTCNGERMIDASDSTPNEYMISCPDCCPDEQRVPSPTR